MSDDTKFLKYRAKILAVNTGDQPDRLTQNITVPTFRGYAPGDVIRAGTLLRDIIQKEFNSTPPTPKVTITIVGSGTTNPAAGSHNVTYGEDFTLNTAVPATGYQLKDIVVDGETKTAPFTIRNITADKTITVTFEELPPTPTYTITATAGANGSINPNGAVSVNEGGSQTFTITPDTDYQIDNVKVDGVQQGVITSYTFSNVTADHTIEATFTHNPILITYTITTSAGAGGTITPTQTANLGDNVNIVITPNSGYQIKSVLVDGAAQTVTPTGMTVPFNNIDADHTVAAEFEVIPAVTHTITASAGANGSISPNGAVTVADGGSQSFTITADNGYEIDDVKVDGTSQGAIATYTFSNVVADHTIEATFKAAPVEVYHIVIADATPSSLTGAGTISPAAGTHDVNVGSSQAVVATPASGFKIKSFTVDSTEQAISDPTRAFTYTVSGVAADATVNIIVEFEKIPTGNIYTQAYANVGRTYKEPTENIMVLGDPVADPAAAMTQIVAGTYEWTSKQQAKSCETFVMAKSLGRLTSIKQKGMEDEYLGDVFLEKSMTFDGVDYWCYHGTSAGSGGIEYILGGHE